MSFIAVKKQMEIISRNVVEIIPENDLVKKLEYSRKNSMAC